jgi:hypothetical protein
MLVWAATGVRGSKAPEEKIGAAPVDKDGLAKKSFGFWWWRTVASCALARNPPDLCVSMNFAHAKALYVLMYDLGAHHLKDMEISVSWF